MRVCAIIVVFDHTKGSLTAIIQRLLAMSVQQIIVINNGQKHLHFDNTQKVKVVVPHKNLGAVGGFSLGIQKALDSDCDHFWLLDEDNLPDEDALSVLCKEWTQLKGHITEDKLMMLSYRPQLFKFLHLTKNGGSLSIGPLKNSYLGFHYRQLFQFVGRRLIRPKGNINSNVDVMKMDMGYFGGLFIHRSTVENAFLPDERFTIYWGDLHFTKRFKQAGGSLYMSCKSVVHDIDDGHALNQKKHFLHHPILDLAPAFKAFDYTTGLMRFESEVQKSILPYAINKIMLTTVLTVMAAVRGKLSRLKLITQARLAIEKEIKR